MELYIFYPKCALKFVIDFSKVYAACFTLTLLSGYISVDIGWPHEFVSYKMTGFIILDTIYSLKEIGSFSVSIPILSLVSSYHN